MVSDFDVQNVRAALAARLDTCWDRLEDAVSELNAVHDVPLDSMIERVRQVVAAERTEGGSPDATDSQ